MIHERSHRDDVTYTCEVCGKNFKRQDNLKQHRWLFRHTIFDIELIKEFQVNLTLTNCKCWFVPFRVSRVTFFTCAICMCNTYSIFRFKEQNKTKKKTNENPTAKSLHLGFIGKLWRISNTNFIIVWACTRNDYVAFTFHK